MSEYTSQAPKVRIVHTEDTHSITNEPMHYTTITCGDVLLEMSDEFSSLIVCNGEIAKPTPQVLADLRSLSAMLNHPDVQRLISERAEQRRSL